MSVNYFALGVKVQPRHELIFRVMFGGSLAGNIWLWNASYPLGPKEKVQGHFELVPPSTFSVEAYYRFGGGINTSLKVMQTSLNGYTIQHPDLLGNAYECRVILLTLQNEFAITY